jgi:Highly conserved protein containing a thioredoxin domain
LQSHYLTVRVDQDANPDLAHRYEDYGWPATVVFAPDGSEIVKRRGYIAPPAMAVLLRAIVDDPTPGPSVQPEAPVEPAAESLLTAAQRKRLVDQYFTVYHQENGGWGRIHKFIHAESMEYALANARTSDQPHAAMARKTLDAARP